MKQLIFALVLTVTLSGLAIWWGIEFTNDCDHLLTELKKEESSEAILRNWKDFSQKASFITPYDLIREADSACENYVSLIDADAEPPDLASARETYAAALHEIRRIHAMSWELIF